MTFVQLNCAFIYLIFNWLPWQVVKPMFQPKITEINRYFNRQFSIFWLVNWPTFNRLFFQNKKIARIIFKILSIFFSKINRISTEFFFKYKKIDKLIFKIFLFRKIFFTKIFFEFFFFRKFFFTNIVFYKFFFGEHFYDRIFFGENLPFHKNISVKIVFTIFSRIFFSIWCLRNNVFCEIFYSKFYLLRIFCFAILV